MSVSRILCPVDFSEASRGALRYGAVLARHFAGTLDVMTALEPLLAEAAAMESSAAGVKDAALTALRAFVSDAVSISTLASIEYHVTAGQAEGEILRASRERQADLIVISSHGLTGFRKMFFGSTTERVLRETGVPVLIVPGDDRGPVGAADATARVGRILVPVLPAAAGWQVQVASAIARTLPAPAIFLHVVEPLRATVLPHSDRYVAKVERERRARAERDLEDLVRGTGLPRMESLIAYGEPSEEIVKISRDRRAGLIVMGLQGSELAGPRIGSVTYRVLTASGSLVLALPPARAGNSPQRAKKTAARKRGRKRR